MDDLKKAKEELEKIKKEVRGLKKDKVDFTAYRESLSADIKKLKGSQVGLRKEIADLQESLPAQKANINVQVGIESKKLDIISKDISDITNKKNSISVEVNSLKAELIALENKIASKIEKHSNDFSYKKSQYEGQISVLLNEINSLQNQSNNLRGKHGRLVKSVEDMQGIYNYNEKRSKEMSEKISSLGYEIGKRKINLETIERNVNAKIQEDEDVQAEINTALVELADVKGGNVDYQKKIKELEKSDIDNKDRAAFLIDWERRLNVIDVAQANKNKYLKKRDHVLREAEQKVGGR